jgi:beta-phosphoglucomutase-like phosphatase (HAD superfamily)
MTDAVVFDMDGVLIDSGAHHRAAWQALLEEIGEEPAHPEAWRLTIGHPSEEASSSSSTAASRTMSYD